MGTIKITTPSRPRDLIQAIALEDVGYVKRRGREQEVLRTVSRLRDHWWRTGQDCNYTPHLMRLKLKDIEEVATTCACYARMYEETD
jgi:hypothetical protein